MTRRESLSVLVAAGAVPVCGATMALVPDNSRYAAVLAKYVRQDGRVDYAGIKADNALDEYVGELARASPDSHPQLFPSRAAKLAYWINAYNALVLDSFAREYPQKRDRLTGIVGKALFFYQMKHLVGGKRRSLSDIEDNTIRRFGDPRIHFAIVCASASCPALSRVPYTAETLDGHLDAEARKYFSEARNFALDPKRGEVKISQIFDWFKEDFGGKSSKILELICRYRPEEAQQIRSRTWRISYFDYDWSPNDIRP